MSTSVVLPCELAASPVEAPAPTPTSNCQACSFPGCNEPAHGMYARYCDQHRSLVRRRRKQYIPTEATDAVVREAYRKFAAFGNRTALKVAALKLQWPGWVVKKRGRELGLSRTKEAPWSEAEVLILERVGWMCDEKIAEKLKASGFSRTPTAVHLKVKRMHIKSNLDGYSATSLADAFGVDSHKVVNWIRRGLLVGELRGTERKQIQGGDTWWIRREDVLRFALRCPEEIDLAKVEKFWFLDLITEGKICR